MDDLHPSCACRNGRVDGPRIGDGAGAGDRGLRNRGKGCLHSMARGHDGRPVFHAVDRLEVDLADDDVELVGMLFHIAATVGNVDVEPLVAKRAAVDPWQVLF